ncbi:MAG TPA: DMT family transporter [Solirubrobacteraceae bacterium]|nr:DMT family transporter [Solirubrobacteraceae bacterium]
MTRRSWLLMGLLGALWGASYLFIKVALDDGVDPVFLVFARLALGALVLVPIAMRQGALQALGGRRGPIAFMAFVQVVFPFLLITYGERHVASSLTGIIVSAAPIFTVLIAARYDDEERPRGIAAAGVVLGILGVVLLFGVDLSGDAAALAGGLMVLLASLGYAIGGLYLKHRLRGVPALGIAASTLAVGAVALAPVALFALPSAMPATKATASLVILGAGGTGIAFLVYYTLIAQIGPARASLVAYIAPGFAVLYGVWLLSEPLTAGALLGLVLILAGSWIAAEGGCRDGRGSRRRRRWSRRPRARRRSAGGRDWPNIRSVIATRPRYSRDTNVSGV